MRRVWFALMVGLLATTLSGAGLAVEPTPVTGPVVVEGTITAVVITGPASGKITVQPPQPCATCEVKPPVTFAVNEKTQLFKDGVACKLADIKVGDGCRALCLTTSTGELVAQIVYAKTLVPPLSWVKGTIVEKTASSQYGRTFKLAVPGTTDSTAPVVMWFAVTNATKITLDGNPATYDDLAVGQTAEVGYVPVTILVYGPIPASVVNAKSPPPPPVAHLIGKLVGIDLINGIIRVLPNNANCTNPTACAVPFKVTNETKIDKFGPVKLPALTIGDTVDVTYKPASDSTRPPVAISIVVLPETFVGIVDRVVIDPSGVTGVLYLRQRTTTGVVATPVPFKVVEATKIIKNGAPAKLADLVRGDAANVKYFQFGTVKVAALVEAKSPVSIAAP